MARSVGVTLVFGAAVLIANVGASATASAQPLGTFRWQTQPFCNVLILNVTVSGGAYRLEGTDDQCGGTPASAIGMAYHKADGTVGVGLTLVFSSAASLHVDGTIVPGAGFSGSWTDSVGRVGSLFLTPGPSTGGPLRPVVAPVITYGSTVAQPPGGSDKGFSATVTTDTGTSNDAAGLYGRFGGELASISPAPAGVRGDSTANVGVMGLTDTGFAVVGGAGTGTGVQGYATSGANSIAVQAVHVSGGTALEINNGAIKVAGAVRAAFRVTIPAGGMPGISFVCTHINHPLLNFDPDAIVLATAHYFGTGTLTAVLDTFDPLGRWQFCGQSQFGGQASVLVIKQ
jgi:hypothetical protein